MAFKKGCGLEIFNHSGFRPSLPAPGYRCIWQPAMHGRWFNACWQRSTRMRQTIIWNEMKYTVYINTLQLHTYTHTAPCGLAVDTSVINHTVTPSAHAVYENSLP